jgi:hypothetical protein
MPIGYAVRLAIITNVYTTYVECMFTDREGEHIVKCPVPHPHAGDGSGIFVGFEKGTRVKIAMGPQEQPHIVGIIPNRSFYFSQEGVPNSTVTMPSYPKVEPGEIVIQGKNGSTLGFMANGNISLEAGAGELEADLELSTDSRALYLRTDNTYRFTEAGRTIEGLVKRDENSSESLSDSQTLNFLSGESYDSLLMDVGRSPLNEVYARTSQISKRTTRNPSLVEKRDITYEYANTFNVRGIPLEATAMKDGAGYMQSVVDPAARENRRTDVLDLNIRNYNHLIEKVEGTVVDIYGNILDLNRNVIDVPTADKINTAPSALTIQDLQRTYSFVNRSIKYHFEINSRKPTSALDFSLVNTTNNIAQHSRWSVDVDGEGLTKINIPASSELGNIPMLGRYYVSRNPDPNHAGDGYWKDPEQVDVRFLPFAKPMGEQVADSNYMPETSPAPLSPTATSNPVIPSALIGTANYAMGNAASAIFASGRLRNPYPGLGATSVPLFSTSPINNQILQSGTGMNPAANAGGRSLSLNLDGSAEISIGADTIDRKSLVLDLAGSKISHVGRDRNGRGVVQQIDGDVIINLGGPGISTDTRFAAPLDTEDRPGRVEIHLHRPGGSDQVITIDENGMSMQIFGNGVIQASGDLTLTAGGSLLLDGENIYMYGTADTSTDGTRAITGSEQLMVRDGRNK